MKKAALSAAWTALLMENRLAVQLDPKRAVSMAVTKDTWMVVT